MYEYNAKVVKVVDGDTVDLAVDLGFDIWHNIRIRLYGINCPEKNTDLGKTAKQFTIDNLPIDSFVVLKTVKDKAEKFGRILGEITPVGNDKTINKLLIENNLAAEYFGVGSKEDHVPTA